MSESDPTEVSALISLFRSTDGFNWRNTRNWCSEQQLSQWHGVDEEEEDEDEGSIRYSIISNSNISPNSSSNDILKSSASRIRKRVVKLRLIVNNLSGPLPQAFSQLKHLQYLDLSNNCINGPFPEWIGKLQALQELKLHYNQFFGELPAHVFSPLSNLTGVHLEGNNLSGTIPESLFKLSKISKINLAFNKFTGEIPDMSCLTSIKELKLRNNKVRYNSPTL